MSIEDVVMSSHSQLKFQELFHKLDRQPSQVIAYVFQQKQWLLNNCVIYAKLLDPFLIKTLYVFLEIVWNWILLLLLWSKK